MKLNFTKMNRKEPKKTAELTELRAALKAYLEMKKKTHKRYAEEQDVSVSFLLRVLCGKGTSGRLVKQIRKDVRAVIYSGQN